ncbi:hypothetical protein Ahy_B05g075842 [Arachis hypogaea]|uniref:Uncharacterized protein n=1 Tax=Arachis hypogaea TaxID=3818 RepID=A0A444Z260_ARAHY|nr:hypothetical protein Ahy_B05g075842 [Arachis hypogaea]
MIFILDHEVVSAMCMLLNDRKYHRFEEEIYCVPILSQIFYSLKFSVGIHYKDYIDPNTKKAYRITQYKDYLPFLDKTKLASHPFISYHF